MSEQHEKDVLTDCLFSRQDGARLRNIKFFRGTRDLISEEEFRTALSQSIERRKAAEPSTEPPKTNKAPIDLRRFVADM